MPQDSDIIMKTIYKNPQAKAALMALYERKLAETGMQCEEEWHTVFGGLTHVLVCGDRKKPAVMLLHGINAGAPMALEAVKGLESDYCIYAVDSVGQATKSAENRLSFSDLSYGRWLSELMTALKHDDMTVIGVSYGAFLLNQLIRHSPEKVNKAIYIVPSGFANGDFMSSMKRLSLPLMKFQISKKDEDLIKFMDAFYISKDAYSLAFQKLTLTGVKMDYRRPPLLKKGDVQNFKSPVYALIAGDDVFFPGDITLKRIKEIFEGYKESYMLKHARHVPDKSDYPVILEKLKKWLAD